METVRLDRWLWAARFYKTRSLAANAVKRGNVKVNTRKCKAAKMVKIGDVLNFRQAQFMFEPTILALSEKRLGAKLALDLYREPESIVTERGLRKQRIQADRQMLIDGKPNKKDRRLQQAIKRAM
ncbi:MAG: RNA-binding S4 domain-containing protein [Arenicellales bacterium]